MIETKTEKTVDITVIQQVPLKMIQNMMVGFWENGYSPWCNRVKSRNLAPGLTNADFKEGGKFTDPDDYYPSFQIIPFTEGCSLTIIVDDPDKDEGEVKEFTLDLPAIYKGTQVFATKYPTQFAKMMSGDDDANTHDILAQCIVYGEAPYG